MKRSRPATAWLYFGAVGMDRAPGSARRGFLGRTVARRSPDELEDDLVECATAYRAGCLGMFAGLAATIPLLIAADWWGRYMHVRVDAGLSQTSGTIAVIAVDTVASLLWLAGYLWIAWVPASRGTSAYGRAAGAVAALEDMQPDERAEWLARYREADRPASAVLERLSRPFRGLVARDAEVPDEA